jgi:putative oxidoreductase
MRSLLTVVFAGPLNRSGSVAILVLRLVAGWAFVQHGTNKIKDPFHWMGDDTLFPGTLQALAALSEFVGGIAWMVGALTPVASLGIGSTMIVAVSRAIMKGQPFMGKGGYELALVFLTIAVVLAVMGPGRYSVDAWLLRRLGRA